MDQFLEPGTDTKHQFLDPETVKKCQFLVKKLLDPETDFMDQFLDPETDIKDQFLDPETDKKCQFLDGHPETDVMDQFLDTETDIMGEGNYIGKLHADKYQKQRSLPHEHDIGQNTIPNSDSEPSHQIRPSKTLNEDLNPSRMKAN